MKLDYDIKQFERVQQTSLDSLKVLKLIRQGYRNQTAIAIKVGKDRRWVNYYFKILKIKV